MTAQTAEARDPSRHIVALDGLRGVAILLVVILHATEALSRVQTVPSRVLAITNVGFTGVDLFFVLSGFLITGILIDAKGSPGFFRVFYARRVLRIFPLYYAYLAIVLFVVPHLSLGVPATLHELRAHQGWFWLYASNIFDALQGGWRIDGAATSHFWSLAVEEQFYLIWPAVVLLCSRRNLTIVCCLLVAGAPVLRLGLRAADVNAVAVYVLTVCRADSLALGALLAIAVREPSALRFLRRNVITIICITAVSLALLGLWRKGFGQFDIIVATAGLSVWAAFYGSVIAAVVSRPDGPAALVERAASASWLRFFGKYSYAIYIFHRPLCGIAEQAIPTKTLDGHVGLAVSGMIFVLLILTASTIAAWVSWHVFERYFIALKRYVPYARPVQAGGPMTPASPSAIGTG